MSKFQISLENQRNNKLKSEALDLRHDGLSQQLKNSFKKLNIYLSSKGKEVFSE